MSEQTGKIIIKGVTRDGRKFRPSDWAQRLTTAVARPGPKGRVRFHPKVAMTTKDGVNCVVIDRSLEEEDPMLFEFLTNFADFNNLDVEET
ncbi:DUF3579 domain-containing protein [Thiohalomonas denitrificans]|uniref:DUF3579 domain-containing protein n=1 Tax=Thiohalomonas denitrificans TaxID=415747 RepID=A0A1G5QH27_9GAMM|nr:DUF3579 domain-containing protein [Thiohalomonas denitrificans]SCZ61173.1 Protein of unknown function [Thiohalomonas denitrificans]